MQAKSIQPVDSSRQAEFNMPCRGMTHNICDKIAIPYWISTPNDILFERSEWSIDKNWKETKNEVKITHHVLHDFCFVFDRPFIFQSRQNRHISQQQSDRDNTAWKENLSFHPDWR